MLLLVAFFQWSEQCMNWVCDCMLLIRQEERYGLYEGWLGWNLLYKEMQSSVKPQAHYAACRLWLEFNLRFDQGGSRCQRRTKPFSDSCCRNVKRSLKLWGLLYVSLFSFFGFCPTWPCAAVLSFGSTATCLLCTSLINCFHEYCNWLSIYLKWRNSFMLIVGLLQRPYIWELGAFFQCWMNEFLLINNRK